MAQNSNLIVFSPHVTEVGLKSLMGAIKSGISINITHIGVGDVGYDVVVSSTGKTSQIALKSERTRVKVQDVRYITPEQKNLSFVIEGSDWYYIREIGFYLDDGTLYAVASHPTQALSYQSANSKSLISLEFVIDVSMSKHIKIVASGADLNLLMTREVATLSAFQMRVQLKQLQQEEEILNLKEVVYGNHS